MMKTELPTLSDYDKAIKELQKINDDLFYEDFKNKIESLTTDLERIALNSTTDFKRESEEVVSRANILLRQIEALQNEIRGLVKEQQQSIIEKNQEFLEIERNQLLFVYNELEQKMASYSEENQKLQQIYENNNNRLINQAMESISSVDENIKEFIQQLSIFSQKNKEMLEQYQTYVTSTKDQFSLLEQKISGHLVSIQQLLSSFTNQFQNQVKEIKNNLVIREESLMIKVTQQYNNWMTKQEEYNEVHEIEEQKRHEEMESLIKEELAIAEKRSSIKMYLLLSIIVIQTIVIIWGTF